MYTAGIYAIINLINDKVYIGSAVNLERRWKEHRSRLACNVHDNQILQRSYNKHGKENYFYVILEYCEQNNLIKKETYWIWILNVTNKEKGYNICSNGRNSLGAKRSQETKDKISKANKGKVRSEEQKKKISATLTGRKGRKLSEEHKKKISLVHKNKIISDEQKKKFSLSQKGKPWSDKRRLASNLLPLEPLILTEPPIYIS